MKANAQFLRSKAKESQNPEEIRKEITTGFIHLQYQGEVLGAGTEWDWELSQGWQALSPRVPSGAAAWREALSLQTLAL